MQIGTQIWMEENLKAAKYRDGSAIPNVSDSALWYSANTGAYCDYHNLASEGAGYGHLYNWYAIADSRNMCPLGWHVPSDSEWTILTTYCGGAAVSGKKLKENCTTRWAYLDSTWGTNETGFTGLCVNYRMTTGAWSMAPDNNHDSWFWTSTELSANSAWAWARSLRWCYNDVWIGSFHEIWRVFRALCKGLDNEAPLPIPIATVFMSILAQKSSLKLYS